MGWTASKKEYIHLFRSRLRYQTPKCLLGQGCALVTVTFGSQRYHNHEFKLGYQSMKLKLGITSFYWWTWFSANSWLNLKVRNSGRWRLVGFRPKVSYANNCNMTISLYRSNQWLNFNGIHKLRENDQNDMVSWFLSILEKAILLWLLQCVILVFWILYCTNIYRTSCWIKLCYKLPLTCELVVLIAACHLF